MIHSVLAEIQLHPVWTTIVAIVMTWLLWEAWRVTHPGPLPPKEKLDVGKIKVTVVSIDQSADFDLEFIGQDYGFSFRGERSYMDALWRAQDFVEDTKPILMPKHKSGYNADKDTYMPRQRVHRYIIGPREEHFIEYQP